MAAEVRMCVEEYLQLIEATAKNVKRVGKATRTIARRRPDPCAERQGRRQREWLPHSSRLTQRLGRRTALSRRVMTKQESCAWHTRSGGVDFEED